MARRSIEPSPASRPAASRWDSTTRNNQRDDPVVYFYEEFLSQYDPEQRKNYIELAGHYLTMETLIGRSDSSNSGDAED